MTLNLPPREALLNIEFLERVHAEQGAEGLETCLRRGAERYGGAVTAVADAAFSFDGYGRLADDSDLRQCLAHRLLGGSWSSIPGGPRRYRRTAALGYYTAFLDRTRREAFRATVQSAGRSLPPEPSLPSLSELRLLPSVERAWVAHSDGIWGCDLSPDGRHVLSGSRDRTLAVWDADRGTLVSRVRVDDHGDVRDCFFTPDGTRIVSAHADGRVTVWTHNLLEEVFAADTPFPSGNGARRWRRIAVSPDSSRLAIADWQGVVRVRDLNSGDLVATLQLDHVTEPLGVFWPVPTQCVIIVTRPVAGVTIWDLPRQCIVAQHGLEMPREYFMTAAITSDQRFIVASTHDETFLWQIGRPEPVARVRGGIAGRGLAISSDGRYIATSDSRDIVRLRTLPALTETGRWLLPDLGGRDLACAVAFSPDNSRLVVAGWEGVIRCVGLPPKRLDADVLLAFLKALSDGPALRKGSARRP